MATSGSTDFILTGAELVEEAFKVAGIKTQEQTLSAAEFADGFLILNLMVKNWEAQALHLWTKTEGIVFINPGDSQYFLGQTGTGSNATNFDDFISTTLSVDVLAAATSMPVVSTTGMLANDVIGIELSDGTRQWTTIVSVDPGPSLTILDPLTQSADSTNTVYTYTNQIKRPLRILGMRRGNSNSPTEIEVNPFDSRSDYFNQSNKQAQGTITQYFYTPELGNGRLYVWQTGQSVKDYLRITFERPIEDFDLNNDDPDFPIEWSQVLIYNLAAFIGVEYNIPERKQISISSTASNLLDQVLGFDTDRLYLQIQPDFG